nr:exosome complex component MTR3-like [Leptinotarsa decemlineata]
MPIDHKRINGPEDTVPYQLFSKLNTKSLSKKFKEILKDGKRNDSRAPLEHRKIFLKSGIVTQAKGSAYIELDKTKVIVSVYDPREIPNRQDYSLKGEIYCEFKFAPFGCTKRRLHQQDAEEKQYSALMKQALESTVCRHEFPNFQVDIYALVLQNDGSCLSAAITAAGLALSHAGVPMYDMITSVTVGIQNNVTLLDPTSVEQNLCEVPIFENKENKEHGVVVVSMLHTHKQISQFHQSGSISLDKLNEVIGVLEKGCEEIVPLVQKSLVRHVIKTLQSSGD